MQFNSIHFMIFFPIVLIVYFLIPRKLRKFWLLIASYYFYMSWNPRYAVLIFTITILSYIGGLLIEKIEESSNTGRNKSQKKMILTICISCSLCILGIFKYGNFFIETLNKLLQHLHINMIERRFDFLLPVGISFYTFQAVGYIIDVYRQDIKAEKNLIEFALFVSFFPQLVAGPIERSKNLLTQIQNIASIQLWNAKRIVSGCILMIWGFFMKMVIADRASILVDTVYDNYLMYGSTELCLATIFFAIQIYCDFNSYSLIAIGASKIMGITLMENFNTPYFAQSIKDFWDRWHISLSTWFKDYLYIPLGGNRRGNIRKGINKMLVFLISGLWHGASWHYVVWGGLHGLYQVAADFFHPFRQKWVKKFNINTNCFSWKLLQIIITFGLADFAWIFFRADSVLDALRLLKRILIRPTPWLLFNGGIFQLGLDRVEMNVLIFSLLLLILVDLIRYKQKISIDIFLMKQNIWFEWMAVIALIVMIFIYGEYGPTFNPQQFIYFQF
ncbi:MAG: MBOAT family protein [Clostridium sp.]|nr:MBOAT family protein [Clostridium sp.]